METGSQEVGGGSNPLSSTHKSRPPVLEFGTSVSLWLRYLCQTLRPGFGSWATLASVPLSHQFHPSDS
jgi:hypothetical protein